MDAEILEGIKYQAKKELAKRSYEHYVEFVHEGIYQHAKHTRKLCRKMEEILSGKCKRLIVTTAPRHSKSMTITETFPSFYLGKNPHRTSIIASYGAEFASDFSKRNRDKIKRFGRELFDVSLSKEKAGASEWNLHGHRGGLIAGSFRTGLTGKGGDAGLIIVDDPLKNREEADSITIRNKVFREFNESLYTRKQKDTAFIIILTRWHEDDLVGRLLADQDDYAPWEVVNMPAICEDEDDFMGREIGEALWPKKFDIPELEHTKRKIGTSSFASLYQQRPSPAEGVIFIRDWWRYYTQLPSKFDRIIQSWDFAFKDKKDSDYVVGQVWGKIGADCYLIDQFRAKVDFVKSQEAFRRMADKYPLAKQKYVEDAANGTAIISSLKREISGIIAVNVKTSKTARAYSVTPEIESGNVFLPSPSTHRWVEDFVEECNNFPNGKNDDQVDAMTQALSQLGKKTMSILR